MLFIVLQYIVKVEQQKAAATTGFAQAGGTCGQLVAQYMAFVHKTLSTAPPVTAPVAAPAPVPVPAVDNVPGLDSLDGEIGATLAFCQLRHTLMEGQSCLCL